jgi:hypothetical protein
MKQIEYGKILGLTGGAVIAGAIASQDFMAKIMANQIMAAEFMGITVGAIAVTAIGIGVADYLMK